MTIILLRKFDDDTVTKALDGDSESESIMREIAWDNFCNSLPDCPIELLEEGVNSFMKSIHDQKGKKEMTERPGACAGLTNRRRIQDASRKWTKADKLFPIGIPGIIRFDESGNEADKANNVFERHDLETYDKNIKDSELAEEQNRLLKDTSALLKNVPERFQRGRTALLYWIKYRSYPRVAEAMGMNKSQVSQVKNLIYNIRNRYLIRELIKQGWAEDHLYSIMP
jgi:hypothetical protein